MSCDKQKNINEINEWKWAVNFSKEGEGEGSPSFFNTWAGLGSSMPGSRAWLIMILILFSRFSIRSFDLDNY